MEFWMLVFCSADNESHFVSNVMPGEGVVPEIVEWSARHGQDAEPLLRLHFRQCG
jgi:hypothetical protein